MVNQQQTNNSAQLEDLTEALAAARRMQQDWLNYGLNFVHIYVEDVEGDWLETWGDDEISNSLFDALKDFLVSDDDVAIKIRKYIGDTSLFDLAVNLEECLRISREHDKTSAVKNVLANDLDLMDDLELLDLANNLVDKLL
ncbi:MULTISPECIES: hypothetical protein [unclassified Anabaena]|uniref:hypothetical protein n=1 Tax=unclassified Anabaena TaxID=2619674 RepID=UPI0014474274|nr:MULTISPECIES: hypothetical protein [unclassified Anabaena]MTJ07547.1 hypothetical protein [Anabaena sp. UHCC 0204]MTJ52620.1 hypothetical protein [Anabaena sp. UHCC 0253]